MAINTSFLFKIRLVILFTFCLIVPNLYAQAGSLESPIPITSNELRKATQGDGRDTHYSLWGNRGEVSIQFSISARNGNAGVEVTFFNKDGSEISDYLHLNNFDNPTTKRLQLVEREQIILKVKETSYGSNNSYPGNLVIKFGGSFFVPSNEDIVKQPANSPNDGSVSLENPTLIKSFQLEKPIIGDSRERFYAFVAKPGRVTISLELKATIDIAGVEIYLLDKQGNQLGNFVQHQAAKNSIERMTTTISVKRLSSVILKIKEMSYGSRGSYPGILSLKFTGAFVSTK